MENYAGKSDKDEEIAAELEIAKIKVSRCELLRDQGEVKTSVVGDLHGWSFRRAWYYWIAKGPGIPPEYADRLHEKYGQEVRVDGHCGCPSPKEWFKGFAVGHYHIDTQLGLCALADTIRQVADTQKPCPINHTFLIDGTTCPICGKEVENEDNYQNV